MTELDAVVERDLRVIDQTIDRGQATAPDPAQHELEEMVLALGAEAPEPDPAFAAELGERVVAGFPRRRVPHPSLPAWLAPRRPSLIALAGVASVVAAVVGVASLSTGPGGDEMSSLGSNSESSPALSEDSSGAAGAGPRGVAPPSGPSRGFAPGARTRRIERSASLALAAPEDRLERVADEVVAVTDRLDGFVLRSSVSTGEEGASFGNFELRVPARRLQDALAQLSKLGDVRTRTQAGQDITRRFVSVGDRLEGARAQKASLLSRLEEADSDTEAESIRRRLDLTSAEINGLRGQLRQLRLRSNYASVSVTLERANDGERTGGDGLGGALGDGVRSLSDSIELMVRLLGVLLVPGALAGVIWLAAQSARRRRREATLG